jgi:hypothetical protein
MPAPIQPTAAAFAPALPLTQPFASTVPAAPALATPPAAWPPIPGAPYPGQFAPYGAPPAPPLAPGQPWYGAAGPYGAPPTGYHSGKPYATYGPRPLGIAFLTVVEAAIGCVVFLVALDLFRCVYYAIDYQDTGELGLDLVMGLGYFAASVALFGVAREIWSMRHWVWMRACLLNIGLIGLILVSVIPWGLNTLDVVGIVANGSALVCLNVNAMRRIFGRSPITV